MASSRSAGRRDRTTRTATGSLTDVDQCPEDAEDKDGFEDSDGCPDVDNDDDGIIDKLDACPNVAGVETNDPKTNGCPAPPGAAPAAAPAPAASEPRP